MEGSKNSIRGGSILGMDDNRRLDSSETIATCTESDVAYRAYGKAREKQN